MNRNGFHCAIHLKRYNWPVTLSLFRSFTPFHSFLQWFGHFTAYKQQKLKSNQLLWQVMMVEFEMKENKLTWITKCASYKEKILSISLGSLGVEVYHKQPQTCVLIAIEHFLYGSASKRNMNINFTHLPLKYPIKYCLLNSAI